MTYEEKLSAATDLISQHNTNSTSKIDSADFIARLKEMGAVTEAGLRVCSYEDLTKCGIPTILARLIANTFRSGSYSETVATKRQVDTMSIEDLLGAYDPREPDSRVARRLKTITGDKKCIVFLGTGAVAIEPSAKLVRELRDGLPEIALLTWDGDVHKTHRIGERPARTFDENPLYPGQPLRGGICGISGIDWTGVALDLRRVIYLAVMRTHEITVTPDVPMSIESLLHGYDGDTAAAMQLIRRRFRRAAVLFDELNATDSLPSLKINPSASAGKLPEGRKVV